MNVIGNFFGTKQNLAKKFDFARTQGATAARVALPAKVKADQLPHRIQAQATGHHRVSLKVTTKKPQVRIDIELGDDLPLAVFAALVANVNDPVNHEHIGRRQLRITRPEEFATTALK